MNIDEILSNFLNGEPLHDAMIIGILFAVFFEFYKVLFSSVFCMFKK
uniref:Uncharacterized protein n=1 Tax=Dulem virus 71 TaxID=3145782 RepID=A0AAU8B076_9VIRU